MPESALGGGGGGLPRKSKKKKKKLGGEGATPHPGPDPPGPDPPPGLSTPHLCGQTDACKNITLATTSLRPVINQIDTSIIEHVLTGLTLYLSKFFQK